MRQIDGSPTRDRFRARTSARVRTVYTLCPVNEIYARTNLHTALYVCYADGFWLSRVCACARVHAWTPSVITGNIALVFKARSKPTQR